MAFFLAKISYDFLNSCLLRSRRQTWCLTGRLTSARCFPIPCLLFSRIWDFLSFRKKLLRAGFPLPADTASVSSFLLLGADHCAEVNNRQVRVHRRHRQELLPCLWHRFLTGQYSRFHGGNISLTGFIRTGFNNMFYSLRQRFLPVNGRYL